MTEYMTKGSHLNDSGVGGGRMGENTASAYEKVVGRWVSCSRTNSCGRGWNWLTVAEPLGYNLR